MATLYNGILGGFSGKVGNIVGYRYRNKFCIRQMPVKSTKLPSTIQLSQRSRFSMAVALANPLRELLQGLPKKGKRQVPAFQTFLGKIVKTAIKGAYPNYSIDFSALKPVSGKSPAGSCHSIYADQSVLTYSWCPDRYNQIPLQKIVLLAYNTVKEKWLYRTCPSGEDHGVALLELPCSYMGDRIESYMYFIFTDGSVSDSIYLGNVTIPSATFGGSFIPLN